MAADDVIAEIHGFSEPDSTPTQWAAGLEQLRACRRVRPRISCMRHWSNSWIAAQLDVTVSGGTVVLGTVTGPPPPPAVRDMRALPIAVPATGVHPLELPADGETSCGARTRTEMDTPFSVIRNTVRCELQRGHGGPDLGQIERGHLGPLWSGYRWLRL